MENLVLISCAVAFLLAVLEQIAPLGKFKALISLLASATGASAIISEPHTAVVTAVASAFMGPLLVAVATRVTAIPLAISRPVGQRPNL